MWQVDWEKTRHDKMGVWCVNPDSHRKDSREWRFRSIYLLRDAGVNIPVYRKDSWDIDWSRRDVASKLVWARNVHSKMPTAREWHWIGQSAVLSAGLKWKPLSTRGNPRTGRYVTTQGYVHLSRSGMTQEDIALCEQFRLFRGKRSQFVKEHHLVAVRKFGIALDGKVVRHVNGIKSDNSAENLVLGTVAENNMDHETARLMVMYWRNKYEFLAEHVK